MSASVTSRSDTPILSVGMDYLDHATPVFSASRNPCRHPEYYGNSGGKVKEKRILWGTHFVRHHSNLSADLLELLLSSRLGSVADSTIIRGFKKTEAIKEIFGQSLVQLKQEQAK